MLFCCCYYDLIYLLNPAIVGTCCLTLEMINFSFFSRRIAINVDIRFSSSDDDDTVALKVANDDGENQGQTAGFGQMLCMWADGDGGAHPPSLP